MSRRLIFVLIMLGLLSSTVIKMLSQKPVRDLATLTKVGTTRASQIDSDSDSFEQPKPLVRVREEKGSDDRLRKSSEELGPEGIRREIAALENDLEQINAFELLNADMVGPKERARLGDQLRDLDRLRAKEVEQELLKLESDVAELAASFPARLKAYQELQP